MNNSNEERFQKLIQSYKERYLNDYSEGFQKAGDKKYYEAVFKREILEKKKSEIYNANNLNVITHFRNEKLWLEDKQTADALDEYCEVNNKKQDEIYNWVAEYDAIMLVWHKIDTSNKVEMQTEPPIETTFKQPSLNSQFELNEKVISKIDFIRIINALYELRSFVSIDGSYPSKQGVMKIFGNVIGIDLTNYDKDLSKALNGSSIESNIDIFNRMMKKTTTIVMDKLNINKI